MNNILVGIENGHDLLDRIRREHQGWSKDRIVDYIRDLIREEANDILYYVDKEYVLRACNRSSNTLRIYHDALMEHLELMRLDSIKNKGV